MVDFLNKLTGHYRDLGVRESSPALQHNSIEVPAETTEPKLENL